MEIQHISRVMRKSTFCICLKHASYHFVWFCYLIEPSLISKSEISSLNQSSVAVQIDLYRNRSEAPKIGFFTTRLILRGKHIAKSTLFNCRENYRTIVIPVGRVTDSWLQGCGFESHQGPGIVSLSKTFPPHCLSTRYTQETAPTWLMFLLGR